MEIANLLKDIIVGIMWPLTVLISFFYLKNPIIQILQHAHERLRSSQGFRAKFGSLELDFETKKDLKEQALLTTDQVDPVAKLQKAKLISQKATILQELSEKDVRELEYYKKTILPHTFLADWWRMSDVEKERLNDLMKKGIVGSYQVYNDEMCYFTPLGVEVLKTLGIIQQESSVEQVAEPDRP